jgi:hypothetical protein
MVGLRGPVNSLALVVGGSQFVWEDALAALVLATPDAVFVINDMIPRWPGPIHAVTLHPDKLPGWLGQRDANGFEPPASVWAHRRDRNATHVADDWQGSSGLFAVKIALFEQRYRNVLLAGVPMDRTLPHFVRGRPWSSASAFLKGWRLHMAAIKSRTRSMGGWTAEQLGWPSNEWLAGIYARPPDSALMESVRRASMEKPT